MTDYSQLAVVDVETTGLDPDRHEIWEIALKLPFEGDHHWFLPVDLGRADPYSLRLGGFYERYPKDFKDWTPKFDFAAEFSELTRGRHLVGNVVSFDEERLRKLLRNNRACPAWHYHLVDVEALVAGKLGIAPPWKSPELSEAIGVAVPTEEEKHSAERDVRWAWEMYVAVMEPSTDLIDQRRGRARELIAAAETWRHWWVMTHGKSFLAGDQQGQSLLGNRDAAEVSLERAVAAFDEGR